jgi:hypothetical protein
MDEAQPLTNDRRLTDMPKRAQEQTSKEEVAGSRPVIVTTAHKGVFFGYATDTDGAQIRLERARLAIYWSKDVQGFMGLAERGPTSNCTIGAPATITLRDITSVLEVTAEAETKWLQARWQK